MVKVIGANYPGSQWLSYTWWALEMNLEMFVPLTQVPEEIKNPVVRVTTMLSPDFVMLEVWVPVHTIPNPVQKGQCTDIVSGRWLRVVETWAEVSISPKPHSVKPQLSSATGPPPHSHVSSSECRKVTAVDAARVSYHSFLDCYTVPKFGVLSSHRISKHLRRRRKAM